MTVMSGVGSPSVSGRRVGHVWSDVVRASQMSGRVRGPRGPPPRRPFREDVQGSPVERGPGGRHKETKVTFEETLVKISDVGDK